LQHKIQLHAIILYGATAV